MSLPCKLVGCKEGMFAREKVHTLCARPSEFLLPHVDERETVGGKKKSNTLYDQT